MEGYAITSLEDLREIRQVVLAQPPAVVRGSLYLLVLLLAAALAWAAISRADLVALGTGAVRTAAEATRVQAAIGGTVRTVLFEEGSRVQAGALLVELDDEILRVNRAKVEAELGALDAEAASLASVKAAVEAEIASERRQAEIELEVARAALEREERLEEDRLRNARVELTIAETTAAEAARSLERRRDLHGEGLIAAAELEQAQGTASGALARFESARAQAREDASAVELARRKVKGAGGGVEVVESRGRSRLEDVELKLLGNRSRREQLQKDKLRLELDLDRSRIRAPIGGVVTKGDVQAGDLLEPGRLVAMIASGDDLRFDALFPNSEIAGLCVGQPARVKLDAYPHQQYGAVEGRVAYIAPDSTRPEEAAGPSFYKVRIALPRQELASGHPIELGMTGRAEIARGRESLLRLAFQRLQDKVRI